MEDALKLCLARIDKVMFIEVYFAPTSEEFQEIYGTTWKHLEDEGLLKSLRGHGYDMYQFTGRGWRVALEITGELESPELKANLGKLSQTLKDEVKGRQDPGFLSLDQIAERSGLGADWIFNALDGELIQHCFHQVGAEWEHRGKFVRVPIDFGLPPIRAII